MSYQSFRDLRRTHFRLAPVFLFLLYAHISNIGVVAAPPMLPRQIRHAGMTIRTSVGQQQGMGTPGAPSDLREVIPDVVLRDQHGRRIRFYSDLVKGKVFVINFIYTTCRGTCLALGNNFAALQRMFGGRLSRDVRLISISIDPVTDTPQRLKALSKSLGAKPGWTFVTGEKVAMEKLLRALMGDLPRKGEHSDGVLIGDEGRGVLERRWGLAPPETLKKAVDEILTGSRARRRDAEPRRPALR